MKKLLTGQSDHENEHELARRVCVCVRVRARARVCVFARVRTRVMREYVRRWCRLTSLFVQTICSN